MPLPLLSPNDGLTGGPAQVALPTGPDTPAPAPVATPSPTPVPVLPTPGIDIAGGFEFSESILGIPNRPDEAFDLPGLQGGPASRSGGISRGGETTVFCFDEGDVTSPRRRAGRSRKSTTMT